MVASRNTSGLAHSSSSSGSFLGGDGQSQTVGNSPISSSLGNSSNSNPGNAHASLGPVFGDVSNTIVNSVASSGPSVGASSLVTDANSGLSGGPHMQRSASINTDSYMRLPASPLSFSSNNISISGSSIVDGSSVVQQTSNQDSNTQQVLRSQHHQGASCATSLQTARIGQVPLPAGPRVRGSFIADPNNMSPLQKKPRLDIKQEDVLQQHVVLQAVQKPDSMQLPSPNTQFHALFQQQRARQQLLQSIPSTQRAHILKQQPLMQLKQLQQQGMQTVPAMKHPPEGGICHRRVLQYLYHQRQRPSDNSIAYWRKFVAEYFSPRAKKRWCWSLYENVGHHSLGVFPQVAMDAWRCDICHSKSGRGFEATFDILPRLNMIKFGSGVTDEYLFLDFPHERRLPNGIMILECGRTVQESVYEQLRVSHEGHFRVIFSPDLKILSWEFCARRHEELLLRRLVAPKVNNLLQIAEKCHSTISESGSDGVTQQELQTNSNMVITAGRQLARSLDLHSLNDLGFSKRYVRCLQISEVVNSMKDLMDFCGEQKSGPIEGLKIFSRNAAATKLQMQKIQEMEQMNSFQQMSTDPNTFNKAIALQPGLHGQMNNNLQMVGRVLSGSAQSAQALSNYQNMMRQNTMNANAVSLQQEASRSFVNTNPNSFQGQNTIAGGFSGSHFQLQQQQPQHRSLNNGLIAQNHLHPSQGEAMQQHMFQQLLQDTSNQGNVGAGMQQHPIAGRSASENVARENVGLGKTHSAVSGSIYKVPGLGLTTSRNNSFKGTANTDSLAAGDNGSFNKKEVDGPQNFLLQYDTIQGIGHEFPENVFFNNDLEDDLNFDWKI